MLESEYVLLPPPLRAALPGPHPHGGRRGGAYPKHLIALRHQPERLVARHRRPVRIGLLRLSLPTAGRRRDLMFYEGTVWCKREFDCPTPLMTDWWNYGGLTR